MKCKQSSAGVHELLLLAKTSRQGLLSSPRSVKPGLSTGLHLSILRETHGATGMVPPPLPQ